MGFLRIFGCGGQGRKDLGSHFPYFQYVRIVEPTWLSLVGLVFFARFFREICFAVNQPFLPSLQLSRGRKGLGSNFP